MRERKIIPPGKTIEDSIRFLKMSKEEFAKRLGVSSEFLERLLLSEEKITPDLALALEALTGSPANFWKMLESKYRSSLK